MSAPARGGARGADGGSGADNGDRADGGDRAVERRLVVEADGGSRGNPGPAGYGAVVRDAETGEVLREVAAGIGRASNNVAEYAGLIGGLEAALEFAPSSVEVRMDSKLVVEQMAGRWQVKHPDMRRLRAEAAGIVDRLPRVTFRHVPRLQNAHADRLANEAMDAAAAGRSWVPSDDVPAPVGAAGAGGNRLVGWMDAPAAPTTTLLLRHGETALSVEKRFSGLGEQSLTPRGAAQATAAAERLGRLAETRAIDAVVTSPLRRARETADVVGTVLGLDVVVDGRLRETDFGDWEGYTFAEVKQKWPRELDAWLADPAIAPPYGESFVATAERVSQAVDSVVAAQPGRTLVLVSHVTPIKTLLRLALDAPPAAMYRMHLDLACLSEIDWYADGPALVRRLNDTAHLTGLPAG